MMCDYEPEWVRVCIYACVCVLCLWDVGNNKKNLNRATHMTQKYSLPLSSSGCFSSSLPPCLSLSLLQMRTLYVAYLQPNNLLWALWHTQTDTHTHMHHVTRCSRHTADRQQLSNWLSAAYYGLERQIGYRECPWTRKALSQSPICSTFLSTADKQPCKWH